MHSSLFENRSAIAKAMVAADSKQSPVFIAYYTINTPYEEEVENLRRSLESFGLSHDIEGVFSLGSWQANTIYKAIFIQNMLSKHSGRPVVYLDADAVVRRPPVLFDTLNCDIAVHYYDDGIRAERELLSSTVYVGPTEKAKQVIELWRYINQEYPRHWDQKNLALALRFLPGVNVFELPPAYCLIFDLMKAQADPVIEQFQASRKFKNGIDNA